MNFKTMFSFALLLTFICNVCAQIIPQPNYLVKKSGFFELSKQTSIIYPKKLANEVSIFQQILADEYNLALSSSNKEVELQTASIVIKHDPNIILTLGQEGYTLDVEDGQVRIVGGTEKGAFYGLQSLRQLVQSASTSIDGKIYIPNVEIKDSPRLGWRSFMLDVSRHFFDIDVIKSLLDEMALLKMNVFHWHLTDDQGWRIPIAKYPDLIKVASKRDSSELTLQVNELGEKKITFDGVPHEGHYSYKDIKEIIEYASKRHITVVPEIDMPSHNQAAMAAYPWLSTTKKKIKVPTVFFGEPYYQNPAEINVADPRVINFFKEVLDEVIALFPSEVIHMGGDEVWYNLWAESIEIKDFMTKNGFKSYTDLQMWFSTQMSNYILSKGKRAMAWNDVLGGHLDESDPTYKININIRPNLKTIIGFWRGDVNLINMAAEKGYDVINSNNLFTYFNFDYNTISLRQSYDFNPVPSEINENNISKVIGLSCHLWTERIANVSQLHNYLFPRIAANAEVGWTEIKNKDFNRFENNLSSLKEHWDRVGITYFNAHPNE